MVKFEIFPYEYNGSLEDKIRKVQGAPMVPRRGDLIAYESDAGLEFSSVKVTDVLVDCIDHKITVYVDLSGYVDKKDDTNVEKEGHNEQATTN